MIRRYRDVEERISIATTRSRLVSRRPDPVVSSLANELDAPIARAALGRVVRFLRTSCAETGCRKLRRIDVIADSQRLLDGFRSPLRQIEVGRVAADVVGVTLHAHLPRRVLLDGAGDFLQRRLRFRLDRRTAEIEID